MSFLINHQSKLLCRYFTGECIDSASGLSWKVMLKTRRRSLWRAKSLRRWPYRFLLTIDRDGVT
jgi:hypothetical protein